MSRFRVALLQMASAGCDQAANRAKGEAFCRRAREEGADLALFPELWNIGYAPCPEDPDGRRAWQDEAITSDGAFFARFRELARELGMAIGLTYLERTEGAPRNTISLIDRTGAEVLRYAKVHTCDFSMESACAPGDGFRVAELDLGPDRVRLGAMICMDREFPESARVLMLGGAEVVVVPNACILEPLRIGQLQARAFENMIGVAMANYAEPDQNGLSVAFDGIAFAEPEGPSRDMLLVQAGAEEGVFLADFDLDRLRAYRERESWGDAFRKPGTYGALLERTVSPPFVRPSARRT